jgi:hypothetical protein
VSPIWPSFRFHVIFNVLLRLAALLVGKMRLTPSQATESYKKLEPVLSVGPTEDKIEQEKNIEAFKKAFIEVLEEHGFKEDTLILSKEQNKSDTKMYVLMSRLENT